MEAGDGVRIHLMVGTKNVNTVLGGESSIKHPLVREEEKDGDISESTRRKLDA